MRKIYTGNLKAIGFLASLISFFILISNSVGYAQVIQAFNSSAAFTVPAGVTSIKVEAWGSGAGGSTGYGGGGAGAFAGNNSLIVIPGNTYTITVGNGGAALNNGAASSFANLVVAAGGGPGNLGGPVANSTGTIRFAGGNGANGAGNGGGGGGGSAGAGGNGGNGINTGGNLGGAGGAAGAPGAGTGGAVGGAGGNNFSAGNVGNIPGAGGGENGNGGAGSGAGGKGRVIVSYFLPPTISGFSPAAACSGSNATITITGTNFSGATSVKFNGLNAASFVIVNPTTITAVIPAGVSTGTISVTTPGGTATSASALIINISGTITLSSGSATSSVCVNTATINIVYTIGGSATGATLTGSLPGGVTSSFSAGTFSITGIPTTTGTFNYTVTTTGSPCTNPGLSGTITVNADATISLSSAPTSAAQTICVNTAIANINYAISGSGTGANVTGLPPGVTGFYSAGVYTISGSPSATGNFNYTIFATGPCINPSLSGSITVTDNGSLTLSSAAGSNNQSTCNTSPITDITYIIGGTATSALIIAGALPAGVNGSFNAGTFTISGTPTATGSYTYTVGVSGSPCINPTASGTITINENASIALSSAPGTDAQVVCALAPINNITYTITGFGTTGAFVTGLPSGVTGAYNAGIFTISGTPTATGSFNYIVTTTGPCGTPAALGSITSNNNGTVVLTSAAGTNAQSVCLSNAITDITYAIDPSATNASITAGALPAGVTGSFAAGVFTISGTPLVSGSFNYTVRAAGSSCANLSASGAITVNENASIIITSAAGSDAQSLCVNTAITNINYAVSGFGSTGATVSGLPAGVTASFAAGIFTISGSPTIPGTFNYMVTTTGPCGTPAALGSITVVANSTITLTAGTASQTKCINSAITTVTYTIGGGSNGATLTGGSFPAGVTGSFASGVFTINGTPIVSGIFPYTITTTGPCLNPAVTGTLTINADATISLSSATGTDAQTKCINTAITNITYNIAGGGTGATVSGLPAGVNGNYSAGLFTISGTATVSGTFNYLVTTTGPCGLPAAPGSISIQANSTITLSSGSGTNNKILCINTPLTNITFAIGGGATVATLTSGSFPIGVTGSYAPGVFTITGTPTTSGSFAYTITTTGPCVNPAASGTILVNGDATISLSSAAGTDAQTKCISSPITNITYLIGGFGTTGATVTGLPAGVTGANSAGVFTISGSASVSGTFNYTVSTTGPCIKPVASGTITVTPNATITRTSAPSTTPQTVCVNNPITTITYAIGGSGTGAVVSGLPAGVNGVFNAGIFTIAGTPTVSGVFPFTVTTTGPCVTPGANSTITVTADATIALTSAANSNIQTRCINNAITNITYLIGGSGTGATITGLAPGLTSAYNSGTKIFTISGTPNLAGTYNYTVTTTGPCIKPALGGTITVTPNATINLSSAAGTNVQTLCTNAPITTITYNIGGSGTGANVTNLPPGITGSYTGGVYTISGTPSAAGTYNYVITTTGPCITPSLSGTLTVNALPVGTLTATETSGTANNNTICAGSSITFTATAGYGSYTFKVNGVTAQSGISNVFNSTTLTNGASVIVNVANGLNCGATFGPVVVTVNALPVPGLSADNTTICPGDMVTFTATGGTNYTFNINGSAVQSGNAPAYTSATLTNGNSITVIVTNSNGCTATSAAIVITVNPRPTGTLNASATTICAGDNVTFTASPGYTNYNFKVNGVSLQNSNSTIFNSNSLTNPSVVSVDVTNASNCQATFNPIVVTVNSLPAGTWSAAENSGTSNDNSICSGSIVTFTATAGFNNYNFKVNGISQQNGVSNIYNTATLANNDLITVVVTNGSNCNASFNPITVTVIPSPAGTLTASATNICTADNINFTATSGFANYNFMINGSTVQNGTGNNYSTTSLANGDIITVEVTSANFCFSSFNPVIINVIALPTGTLAILETSGAIPDDGIICTGATVAFTASPGFSNYNFLLNAISVQNGASNIYSNASLINGDVVTVAVTNAGGCIGLFNSWTISVNAYPVVSPITGTTTVCVNSAITLASATPNGIWSSSNNAQATVNAGGIVTGVANGTVVITYTVTNANGCGTEVNVLVTINSAPFAAPISGNTNICVNNTTSLSSATAGGTWSSGNITVASVDASGIVTGISDGTAVISYTVTNGNNCSTANTVTVTVNALPVLNPITGNFNVCLGNTSLLVNDTDGGVWSSNNISVATINPSTGLVTGVSPGTATISYIVTDGNGCSDTETALVSVWALPVPTLSGPNPICPNSTGTYTTEPGQLNYIWTFAGGTLASGGTGTDNTIAILWDQPGPKTIYVNYTDANGCTGAASATVTTSTGTVPSLSGDIEVCLNADGNYLTNAGQSIYTWTVVGGNISAGGTATDNTATVNWSTPGTGTVSINFTDVAGCVAASPVSLPVLVHNLPTATVNVTASICRFGPAPNINFSGAGGTAPYTFTYNINSGASQTVTTVSGNSVAVAVSTGTAGVFSYNLLSVADGNSCSQLQTGVATITINELPTATVNGNFTVCQNSSSPAINFTGTAGTAPFTFSYNINGGPTQTITTVSGNTVTLAAATGTSGNFVYNLLGVSDANGCSQAQAGSASIIITATPTAIVSGTTSVCQNAIAPDVSFTGDNGTAPYVFTYNINGGSNLTVASIGNTATVPVPTVTAGAFTYSLVSVQDAGAGLCSQLQTGSVTVTVNPSTVGGTVGTSTSVCSGTNGGSLTLAGNTGNVTGWELSTNGGTTWTPIVNTTNSLTYTNLTTTTIYHAIVQSGVCNNAISTSATITVNQSSIGGTVTNNAVVCSGTNSGTLNLTGHTGSVVRWELSINGGASWTPIVNTSTSQIYTNLTQTTLYRAIVSNGVCPAINSTAATITVNTLPTATITGTASVCLNAANPTITFTGATGTTPYIFTYKINGGANLTVSSIGSTANVSAPTTTAGAFIYALVSVQSAGVPACPQNQSGTATVTVNLPPAAFIITPASANICQGSVQPLSSAASASSTGTKVVNSGVVNLAIPDANIFGPTGTAGSTVSVTGIPAGAIINSVTANVNINHTATGDLVINLRAPNGNVINLINERGGTGNNFTNTTISSLSVTPISGSNPYTGTYAADAVIGVGAPNSNGLFPSLYGIPNGNWRLVAEDNQWLRFFLQTNTGNIVSWTLTINYTIPNSPINTVWSPITSLYTDPGGTIAYTGQSLSTVYVKPAVPGTVIYTATATNAANCSTSQTVSVTAGITPVVTISADYCAVPNKVRLTATSVPAATIYIWSNGATTSFIDVDIAGSFDVTVFAGGSCPGAASINVAQELVVNGNFEAGNTGFITPPLGPNQYQYVADGAGNNELVPEGLYGVGPNANTYHPGFWGRDHTTGSGNFMIINGFPGGNPQPIVWQETVAVLPNTNYYFAAWGISLNSAGPFARLQFNVSGAQVGTIATLAAGVNNNSNNGWTRFYGTYTTGPTTTSVTISITDLQNAAGGNDFGLDDISFATLSTFITLQSSPGTDAQILCSNTTLSNVIYSIGNGNAAGPTVTGLPAGVTSSFSGNVLTITGTPVTAGTYTYTIATTGGCLPTNATGTITVQAQAIALSSGSSTTVVCANSPVNIGYTLSGTATGAAVSGLPTGVIGSVSGTSYTISGTPTLAGTYSYTITTTGTCTPVTVTGTITIQAQTIILNSSNNNQTVCINNPIANIQYTVGGTGSGVTISGLPAGVTFSYNAGIVFITGTPIVSGSFNFTVNTTGNCAAATATGLINVTPAANLVLTSAVGTNAQTICRNSPITNISYSVNGATGATVSGLPAGITGVFSAGVFIISGTATANGTFNYTIATSGGCGSGTAIGTITVQSQTIVLTSGSASPSVCTNAAITNIVYSIGGTASGASITGLPSGVSFSIAGNVLTISGTPTVQGSFPYTVTTTGSCLQASVSGTITVQPTAVGGSIASVAICSGGSGTLTVTGQSGTIIRWEFSTDGGANWTPLVNTSITQAYNNITDPTLFRVVVSNGCGIANSGVAAIAIRNYWVGTTSTDWNIASNWADNQIPSLFCADVHIKGGQPNQPTLGSGTATIENLHLYPGALLTVDNAVLKVSGTIFNNGIFAASNGSVEFNGSAAQTIATATFQNNALKNLIITNSSAQGVVLAGPLNIYRSFSFLGTGRKFNTGGFLTLKSTAAETAWVGDFTGNIFTGQATVERYIGTGVGSAPNHGKSWQLLAVPTTGQTIKQAWQEGAATNNGNPNPGFGTMLTSNVANAATQPNPGFDVFTSPGPSIKTYNYLTNTYDGPLNTNNPLYNPKGYFILVRGDRSVTAYNQPAVPTVLRSKGTLFGPSNPPAVTNVTAGKFESVGNPYASALDLRNISKTGGVDEFFYVWDPRLGGSGNLGAFQTIFKVGSNYFAMPGGGSYGSGINNFIQSGQAFLVQATGTNGIVGFAETSKSNGSALVFRTNQSPALQQMMKTNLYSVANNGTTSLTDGVLNMFDDSYSNEVDGLDAKKTANTGENLSIKSNNGLFAIERRHSIVSTDTVFLNIANVRVQNYSLEFTSDLGNEVEGFVEDRYLNLRTTLNTAGTTVVNFTIANIPGSYASDRFRVVFNRLLVVPVTFTSLKAYQQAKNINVEWKTENEVNMQEYVVEKSLNGSRFSAMAAKTPTGNNGGAASYLSVDEQPVYGFNFYRIRSVDIAGKIRHSAIVKVFVESMKPTIAIYPNPITNGIINLQLVNQPAGEYAIKLYNKPGQVILSKQIMHAEGSSTEKIKWDFNLAHGLYLLEVIQPDGNKKIIKVLY